MEYNRYQQVRKRAFKENSTLPISSYFGIYISCMLKVKCSAHKGDQFYSKPKNKITKKSVFYLSGGQLPKTTYSQAAHEHQTYIWKRT
jgi:hypothetical protein